MSGVLRLVQNVGYPCCEAFRDSTGCRSGMFCKLPTPRIQKQNKKQDMNHSLAQKLRAELNPEFGKLLHP